MYECEHCGEVFEEGWSEEESKAEAAEIFGKPIEEWKIEPILVCDDCYQKMLPKYYPDLVEKSKKII